MCIRDRDREQWDLSGDIIDCFRRYSSELSPEEQEEIIKGIEEGLTDQDVKRYFTLVGAEKMRQYRRVLMVAKIKMCIRDRLMTTRRMSPPSRRRGLKKRLSGFRCRYIVASFAEAWIEKR